jgi:hypothetical protein
MVYTGLSTAQPTSRRPLAMHEEPGPAEDGCSQEMADTLEGLQRGFLTRLGRIDASGMDYEALRRRPYVVERVARYERQGLPA